MATAAALTLLDELARDRVVSDPSLRTQVALIRTLVDEIERRERREESKAPLPALLAQLDEETHRLTTMLREAPATPRPSGVRLRPERAGWSP